MVAIPLTLGLLFGWMGAGRSSAWPTVVSIGYWSILCVSGWIINDLFTRFAAVLLAPWHASLWLVLICGSVLAGLLVYTVNVRVIMWFYSQWVEVPLHQPIPELRLLPVLGSLGPGLLIWVGVNLFIFRALGIERYGFTPAAQQAPIRRAADEIQVADVAPATAEPLFMARVPAKLGKELLAIVAEQHYLRVVTNLGSCLVLYRMSDAVSELARSPGLQVHRSYWVQRDAVIAVERGRGGPVLVLKNGMKVPVSRSLRHAVRKAGLIP